MTVHLVWDFDGVFNALSRHALPEYRTSGTIHYHPGIVEAVNNLQDRIGGRATSYWLTTRQDDVLELATRIGLRHTWEVLDLGSGWDERDFKCDALRRHFADLPCEGLLWMDDTLGSTTRECFPCPVQSVFITPDARTGLTGDDLDAVTTFLAALLGDTDLI